MFRVKGKFAAVAATLLLAACGEAQSDRAVLTAADLGSAWPLTVDQVTLFCPQPDAPMLETAAGLVALNGAGMAMKAQGLTADSPLWKDAASGSGAKADLGPLIARALGRCKG